ncbi:MAG: M23 family metallopeptidase [Alphaproteobacteria bacterium]
MILRTTVLLLALALPAGAFDQGGFRLAWPVACALGDSCHIQQYVDHDPGPTAQDFTCGTLSYDGHDGTDIALPTRAAMAAGVQVLAAAPGIVKGARDGIADFVPKVAGKECGNGVVIQHADGWETQYCHMRQGSLRVRQGDVVQTGTPLGMIGQSGMADFPHLHLSVRHNGSKVDPFEPQGGACSPDPGPGLWSNPEPYEQGGFLDAGFTAAIPEFDAIRAGLPTRPLPATSAGLVLWAYAFGTRAGDAMQFTVTGPQGQVLQELVALEKTQAQMFRATGKRLKTSAWPAGPYQGTVTLTRDGAIIDTVTTQVTVTP